MEATNTRTSAFARWLPLACFTMTVSSTLAVLVLQAITPGDVADATVGRMAAWVVGWLGFSLLFAAGVLGAIFRMGLFDAERFHSSSVQEVTLILMSALIAAILVIVLVKGDGLLWGGASMIMAMIGLVPLLSARLRKAPGSSKAG